MNLILGCLTVFISMGIQTAVIVYMIRYLLRIMNSEDRHTQGFGFDTYAISVVLLILFVGHLMQVAIWAILFMLLGEFNDFLTAFYHSTVNFASLGYGDIVMSEKWRLLGALEASSGVLMFGLSAGTMLSVMTNLFARYKPAQVMQNKDAN
ncbi:MAG: two pore domain potassium channel family protein [Xanthomonadales bacterium]|nr:two pore domain potassium channel family protein [Xanthomonadales bacterium]